MVTTTQFRVAAPTVFKEKRAVSWWQDGEWKDGNQTDTQRFITGCLFERKHLIYKLLSRSYEPQRWINVLSPTYISLSRSGQDLQWTLTRTDRKGRVQSTEDNRHFNDIVMRDRLADLNGASDWLIINQLTLD